MDGIGIGIGIGTLLQCIDSYINTMYIALIALCTDLLFVWVGRLGSLSYRCLSDVRHIWIGVL